MVRYINKIQRLPDFALVYCFPAAAADATASVDPQQLTRININAQPGTSVQITPGGPMYAQVQPREKKSSVGSVETEI